tara:strand:- start:2912 stop:3268 length:357 start_codon:yes stop_codon:yes gene_type:complete
MAERNNLEKNMALTAGGMDASITPVTTIMFGGAEQNEYTGPFYALTALTQAVIDVDQCSIGNNGDIKTRTSASTMGAVATNITIPVGVTIYGNFSSVELDSGTVIAYSKPGTVVTVGS